MDPPDADVLRGANLSLTSSLGSRAWRLELEETAGIMGVILLISGMELEALSRADVRLGAGGGSASSKGSSLRVERAAGMFRVALLAGGMGVVHLPGADVRPGAEEPLRLASSLRLRAAGGTRNVILLAGGTWLVALSKEDMRGAGEGLVSLPEDPKEVYVWRIDREASWRGTRVFWPEEAVESWPRFCRGAGFFGLRQGW